MMEHPAEPSQYRGSGEVAQATLHALFDANPKRCYMVVPNQEEAGWAILFAKKKPPHFKGGFSLRFVVRFT